MNLTYSLTEAALKASQSRVFNDPRPIYQGGGAVNQSGVSGKHTWGNAVEQQLRLDEQQNTGLTYMYKPYTTRQTDSNKTLSSSASVVESDGSGKSNAEIPRFQELDWDSSNAQIATSSSQSVKSAAASSASSDDTGFFSGLWEDFKDLKWYEQAVIVSLALPFVIGLGMLGAEAFAGEGAAAAAEGAVEESLGEFVEVGGEVEGAGEMDEWEAAYRRSINSRMSRLGAIMERQGYEVQEVIDKQNAWRAEAWLDVAQDMRQQDWGIGGNLFWAVKDGTDFMSSVGSSIATTVSSWF